MSGDDGPDRDPEPPLDGTVTALGQADAGAVLDVVNAAAEAYAGRIPEAADTDPYMPAAELRDAMDEMAFFGYVETELLGVVGREERPDVSLVRHLYVRPDHQRRGIGSRLLEVALERAGSDTVLVGTWQAATWAVAFYERHGFENLGSDEALLAEHWSVPAHQRRASVVLRRDLEGRGTAPD